MTELPHTTDTEEDTEETNGQESGQQEGQQQTAEQRQEAGQEDSGQEEPDTFPREYVERLRDENAKWRQRAQQADDYAQRLHTALVEATGRLADPTDLEFNTEHLEDTGALTAAIDDLVARKPHLAARRPSGSIGQGAVGSSSNTVDLAGLLRASA